MGSLKYGFTDMTHWLYFVDFFLKLAINTDVSFFTTLSKYKIKMKGHIRFIWLNASNTRE